MNKEQLIQEKLSQAFCVGDRILGDIQYTKKEHKKVKKEIITTEKKCSYSFGGTVKELRDDGKIVVELHENYRRFPSELRDKHCLYEQYYDVLAIVVDRSQIQHYTADIGADPFSKERLPLQVYQIDVEGLLFSFGIERNRELEIPEIDWNPVIKDKEGNYIEYQRPFCWSLEDKQLLIDSIYNDIEIGKIVLKKNNVSWVFSQYNKGVREHVAFKQVVDGKQRANAIIEFYTNKFPDSYGNYFNDLSEIAKRKFERFNKISYVEMNEDTTYEDILNTFLMINHAGKPMSKEHIDFVFSLKNKI